MAQKTNGNNQSPMNFSERRGSSGILRIRYSMDRGIEAQDPRAVDPFRVHETDLRHHTLGRWPGSGGSGGERGYQAATPRGVARRTPNATPRIARTATTSTQSHATQSPQRAARGT